MSLRPVIAICGTTGVGKSDLAIELASRLSMGYLSWKGARIINADSMQIYRGMDIITNKVPESERRGIEHLLMGFKEPGEQCVVGHWIQDALNAIDETHKRSEIPIIVGGTSYWIQHLIFPGRLVSESESLSSSPKHSWTADVLRQQSDSMSRSVSCLKKDSQELFTNLPEHPPSASTESEAAWQLYVLLSELDPITSSRWHWRDTRKILRSLQIIKETGRRASDVMAEQTMNPSHGKPRFPTLFFWLHAEPSDLNERLDSRVDKMIQRGLLDEVRDLRRLHFTSETPDVSGNQPPSADYTLGIYQAIGFREFNDYLAFEEPSTVRFRDAIERMKLSTRQYAKRQISWIRNKLLPAIRTANSQTPNCAPIYLLDATKLGEHWCSNVKNPGIGIMEDFLGERTLQNPLTLSALASKMLKVDTTTPPSVIQERKMITCSICTVQPNRPVMIYEGEQWDAHKRTGRHRALEAKRSQES